jgi:capsular polysaccharide transport system permease protein
MSTSPAKLILGVLTSWRAAPEGQQDFVRMLVERSAASHSAIIVQIRILKALMLRDIRTRFFGHGLGYLIAVAWPLAHIAVLLLIYSFLGRVTPYGSSMTLYFATGLAPTMAFIYASRWIMLSAATNKPLLGFPIVKIADILFARGILEILSSALMVIILLATLAAFGIDVRPASAPQAVEAMCAALLLGLGIGFINALVALIFPLWITAYALIIIVIWMASGVVFVPDTMPEVGRQIVSWNPVLHSVEWMRVAYYGSYNSRTLDKAYLLAFGFGSVFLSLATLRFGQRILTNPR